MGIQDEEDFGLFGAEIPAPDLSTLQDANSPTNTIQPTPAGASDVQNAATALIENPSACDGSVNPLVSAFQTAYNAAMPTATPLTVDGIYGPLTATALGNYGTAPPVGVTPAPAPAPSAAGSGGQLQNRVATPISGQALADALATAWPTVVGGVAPAVAIRLLLAQSDFETGGWAACWNWNLGNAKHTPGDGTDWFVMTASEGSGSSATMVKSMFRSYPTLQDGAQAYLRLMYKRFSSAWPYVLSGDATGFVQTLKAHGYFTGDLNDYTAGVKARLAKYTDIIPTVQQLRGVALLGAKVGAVGISGYVIGGGLFLGALYLINALTKK